MRTSLILSSGTKKEKKLENSILGKRKRTHKDLVDRHNLVGLVPNCFI